MNRGRIPFSADELAFVEALSDLPRLLLHTEFVHAFGRSDVHCDHIKALCSRNGWATREPWTPALDSIVREHFPNNTTAVVATMVHRSQSAVSQRAHTLGVTKTAEYLASPAACRLRRDNSGGIPFRFTKGHAPANKGLRRPGWAPGRMSETQFKKGARSGRADALYKPIGTTRLSKDGYLEVKIHDGMPRQSRWRAVHLVNWEKLNGSVPAGYALKSIDSNRQNTDPLNWQLVSRSLLPRLNGGRGRKLAYDDAPPELKPTILTIARIEQEARARKRAS